MTILSKVYRRVMNILHLDSILGEFGTWRAISFSYGHLRSGLLRRPVDSQGEPIPWYNYSIIDYLNSFDFSSCSVLEYGGGNSSFWWADRCQTLTTVESELDWYQVLLKLGQDMPNLKFELHSEMESYVGSISSLAPNIVIIDGLYRAECATKIIELEASKLEELQLIIFDNSNWFPGAIKRLSEGLKEFQRVDFSGIGPIVAFPSTTSMFLRKRGLRIKLKDQQIHPTGQSNSRIQRISRDLFLIS